KPKNSAQKSQFSALIFGIWASRYPGFNLNFPWFMDQCWPAVCGWFCYLLLIFWVSLGYVFLLKVLIVKLPFQKCFLVLQNRFLRRGLFQVVSVTSRCESKPDLGASKQIKFMVSKWGLA
ncbi:hypothetical protein ACUL0I_004749, partial [Vibrio vulnificus]